MNYSNITNDSTYHVIGHSIQVISGLSVSAINGILLLTLLRHKVLRRRKNYLFLSALTLLEMFGSLACLFSGLDRIYLHLTGKITSKLSRFAHSNNKFYANFLFTDGNVSLSLTLCFGYLQLLHGGSFCWLSLWTGCCQLQPHGNISFGVGDMSLH